CRCEVTSVGAKGESVAPRTVELRRSGQGPDYFSRLRFPEPDALSTERSNGHSVGTDGQISVAFQGAQLLARSRVPELQLGPSAIVREHGGRSRSDDLAVGTQ